MFVHISTLYVYARRCYNVSQRFKIGTFVPLHYFCIHVFLLVESGDDESVEEESGDGKFMFKTNTYLAKHNI